MQRLSKTHGTGLCYSAPSQPVHISKLAEHRIEKVEDACKIGDMMWVKVTDIDEKGRVNLSHKDAVREIKAKEAAGERVK